MAKSYSAKDKSFQLKDSANRVPLSYSFSSPKTRRLKKLKLTVGGKVTLSVKFSGRVSVTIRSEGTKNYNSAAKTITITLPTVRNVNKATLG